MPFRSKCCCNYGCGVPCSDTYFSSYDVRITIDNSIFGYQCDGFTEIAFSPVIGDTLGNYFTQEYGCVRSAVYVTTCTANGLPITVTVTASFGFVNETTLAASVTIGYFNLPFANCGWTFAGEFTVSPCESAGEQELTQVGGPGGSGTCNPFTQPQPSHVYWRLNS